MFRFTAFFALIALPLVAAASTPPIVWEADLAHCRAEFTVSHMVVSKVWGTYPYDG